MDQRSTRAKRPRLSVACNYCRTRKKRCDERKPACRNCEVAGVACETKDLRRPHAINVQRKRPKQPSSGPECAEDVTSIGTSQTDSQAQPPESVPNAIFNVMHGHSSTINSDDPQLVRRKYVGASSIQVFTQWLDMSLDHLKIGAYLSSRFRSGLQDTEEFALAMGVSKPPLPAMPLLRQYADCFFQKIHPVFPVLDEDWFGASITTVLSLPHGQVPSSFAADLAIVYAVVSLGIDELAGAATEEGGRLLEAAYSLYAHLVARPYIKSAQALVLLAVALRARSKDGNAWQIIGQALRICYSLGHHRRASAPRQSDGSHSFNYSNLDGRVWWTAFCLEKISTLEAGRPSAVDDRQIDREIIFTSSGHPTLFTSLIDLAKLQSRLDSSLFRYLETRDPVFMLSRIGELDSALLIWSNSVPSELWPSGEPLFCEQETIHFAVYLAMQYHTTMITLHRTALLTSRIVYQQQVRQFCKNPRWLPRLLNSESICVESARTILKCFSEAFTKKKPSRLVKLSAVLLATIVCGIQIMKYPNLWTSHSDLALLATTVPLASRAYQDDGFPREFAAIFDDILQLAKERVDGSRSVAELQPDKTATATCSQSVRRKDLDIPSCDDFSSQINTADPMDIWNLTFGDLSFEIDTAMPDAWEDLHNMLGLPSA